MSDMNLVVVIRGAWDVIAEDECVSLWERSAPYIVHHFLALEGKKCVV